MRNKVITILVTTPIDLEAECYRLAAYEAKLNTICQQSGITLKIRLLMESDPRIDLDADAIPDADYFFVLMYQHGDSHAIELFRKAYRNFSAYAQPKLYTYFKEVPSNTSIEEGVLAFMHIVDDEIGHYHSTFTSIDTVALDMILEIASDTGITTTLDIRSGQLFSGKTELLDLNNVPPYANNARLKSLREKKQELDRRSRTLLASSLDDDSAELNTRIADTLQERKAVLDEIDQIEHDTLKLAIQLLSQTSQKGAMNNRIIRAKRLFYQGNIDGARAVLQDSGIEQERNLRWERERAIQEEHELNRNEEQAFVNSRLLLISLLRAQGLTDHTDDEISSYYAECFESTRRFELDPDFLPHYISHLYNTNDFDVFDAVSKEIVDYLSRQYVVNGSRYAHAYILTTSYRASGIMKEGFESSESAQKAELLLRQVLPIATMQLQDESVKAKIDYAVVLSYLGLSRINQFDYQGSRPYLIDSVELGRQIVETDPSYRRFLAYTCNFLALSFYRAHECSDDAVRWSEESRRIRKELYEEAPERYGHFYALGVYVLGAVHRRHGTYEQSEETFKEAIEMLRKLSIAAPARSEPLLASAQGGYAKLLMHEQRYQEAIEALNSAIGIRTRWHERYPQTYGRPLFLVVNRLAEALSQIGEEDEARKVREQAHKLDEETAAYRDLPDSD